MGQPQNPPDAPDVRLVAGIDEAGRGCLAGPVVAAAVILPPQLILPGLKDSKLLSPARRRSLSVQIRQVAIAWSIGAVWPRRIEEINILQATFEAMARAFRQLAIAPDLLLIDGNRTIPAPVLAGRPLPDQQAIVRGDRTVPAISAASIVAKTFRDDLMIRLARLFPGYGLEKHKGYGTREHYAALRRLGPTPMHRLTFRGVAASPCQLPLLRP